MAIFNGSFGNDSVLTGSLSTVNDTVTTSLGNDYVQGTLGSDFLNLGYKTSLSYFRYGFNDFDTVDYRFMNPATPALRIVVDLQLGTVQKFNGVTLVGTDTLIGADSVWGTSSNDTINGRSNWSYEEFRGYGGNDVINGRGGEDGVNYSYAAAAITVNLGAGTVTSTDTQVGSDTLREVEDVIGTNSADTYDARTFSTTSVNKTSFASIFNVYSPQGGNDVIRGNGQTIVNYGGVGGSLTVNLAGQTALATAASIVTGFVADADPNTYSAGTISASGVNFVIGGSFGDTLTGGGKVNSIGSPAANTLSGDTSFETLRGQGGNDTIDGGTGFDRADYRQSTPMMEGIVAKLAAGTVSGDPFAIGTDTLRNIESIRGTYTDDLFDATGFTLNNAVARSVNAGDTRVSPPTGVTLPSLAFNEFISGGGFDTVIGNGATRLTLDFPIERVAAVDSRVVFTAAQAGTANLGLADGGLGTVDFSGTFSVRGGTGKDDMTGTAGFQNLQGGLGNDTLRGGDGVDSLFGDTGDNNALVAGFTDNDLLDGGAGNDILRGDDGNDTLVGGLGADRLEGGLGNDLFDFNAVTESGLTATDRDTIIGFATGDRIDLSTIDANVATTSVNEAFGGVFVTAFTAPGQLMFDAATGILSGNTDADATAEFSLQLVGVTTLAAAAIVL